LTKKFGDWDFYIEVRVTHGPTSDATTKNAPRQHTQGDRYKFWIERPLTKVSLTTCTYGMLVELTASLVTKQAEVDEILDLRRPG
jgi:hypothetical protein